MNIDAMRNAVLQAQIATITSQIEIWNIYSDRTDEDVTKIVTELNKQIADLKLLIK